jgi:putative ATP-binding cassette transporter
MIELFRLASRSRSSVALLVSFGVLSGAAGAGLIWVISEALSRSFPSAATIFVGLAAFTLVTRIGFMSLLGRLHHGAVKKLRLELSRRILATSLRALEETGPARLQAALTADVIALSDALRLLPVFLIGLTNAIACLSFLAWLSWTTFAAMLAFGALGVVTYWLPTQRAIRINERAREREDDLFRHLESLTHGLKELGLHRERRAAFLSECLDPAADDLRRLQIRANDIYGATSSWGLLLFFLLIGMVLFVLPMFAPLDARTLTGYAFAILYLQQPLSAVLETLPLLSRGEIALRKIRSLDLAAAPEHDATPATDPVPPAFQRLELIGVTHAYRTEQADEAFVVGPIDLALARGELVFLIGGNGSGKTTLAKLVTGLYVPEAGELRVNGEPVTDATRDTYRQLFSVVFSDFYLFDRLLGAPRDLETQARIPGYLQRLHLDRKVTITDGRFSTINLSQGQRKRLALLATYVDDRPLYVFDEWAADQDPVFKDVFYRQLLPDLKRAGKTVLVITHDDRYFHIADRIVRLDAGQLVQPGRPPTTRTLHLPGSPADV